MDLPNPNQPQSAPPGKHKENAGEVGEEELENPPNRRAAVPSSRVKSRFVGLMLGRRNPGRR